MTPRPMKTADGTRVQTYPHGTNNTPNFGGKDGFNDVGYERRTFAHQDRILKILDDNDLWQYMDEPGEMMRRYTAIRKADPDMPLLVQLVKLSVAGKLPGVLDPRFNDVVPLELQSWPFPGPIKKKQSAENTDWIINEEAASVFVFALENTHDDPFNIDSPQFEKMKGLSIYERRELADQAFVKLQRTPTAKIIIGPGNAVPFTLFEDGILPREFPGTQLVKYEHNNPKHNASIRTNNQFARMDAYLGGGKMKIEDRPQAAVMTDGKAKSKG